MSFSVEWSKAAAKQLLKIPKKQRLIILSWIQDYLDESEHYCLWPCAKALQGSESGWRSRVGVYRILGRFEGRKAIIEVVRVGHLGRLQKHAADIDYAESSRPSAATPAGYCRRRFCRTPLNTGNTRTA